MKNIIDLMRFLMPMPVPQRWRRKLMSMGSGHPTRIICSALIAQAFDLRALSDPAEDQPRRKRIRARGASGDPRIPSLYAPRDFDISPYFEVVKPTLLNGFDYKKVQWVDRVTGIRPTSRRWRMRRLLPNRSDNSAVPRDGSDTNFIENS